jgi:cellobiose epimerase
MRCSTYRFADKKSGTPEQGRFMNTSAKLTGLRDEMRTELYDHILPFWINHVIDTQGDGFYGRIAGDNVVVSDAPRSAILYTRILWTFSAVYRLLKDKIYLEVADRAYRYIEQHFWDWDYGGVYWMLGSTGGPSDTKKHTYAEAFAIYGLSEYYRATSHQTALKKAVEMYNLLEHYSLHDKTKGYYEAFTRDWTPLSDVRLSEKDVAEHHSMNTHLHLLEAYANLFKVWPNDTLRKSLTSLIELFLGPLFNRTSGHYYTFLDENWCPRSEIYSFGHDIEASWLIYDAARVLRDDTLIRKTRDAMFSIAEVTLHEGLDREFGGLFYSGVGGTLLDTDKHWWVQAEAIVGFVNAYYESPTDEFLDAAYRIWDFTRKYIIDRENGEWFFRVNRKGIPYTDEDKVGPWKCPYHNVRACLEILERTESGTNFDRSIASYPAQ